MREHLEFLAAMGLGVLMWSMDQIQRLPVLKGQFVTRATTPDTEPEVAGQQDR